MTKSRQPKPSRSRLQIATRPAGRVDELGSLGTGQVVVDWGGWLDLFGRANDVNQPLKLTVCSAPWWAFPRFVFAHPDPTIRLAGLLALLSVALGFLSVLLTLLFRFSR
jgi:hypothetical protein